VYKIDISYGQEYELVSGFIKIPRLLDRLGSWHASWSVRVTVRVRVRGPHRESVRASFQIFALTAGGNVLCWEGNCWAGEMSGKICPGRIVLTHFKWRTIFMFFSVYGVSEFGFNVPLDT